jgi:proline iminopeptidase
MKAEWFFLAAILATLISMAAAQTGEPVEGKVERTGLALHYRLYGKGTPLLVLSGGPGFDCDYMEPVARELSSSYRTILVELRGTGRSRPAQVNHESVNLELYLADLEALRTSLHLERWAILGHSAGAVLAMRYAIAFPGRVRVLILADSGPVRQTSVGAVADNVSLRLTSGQSAAARQSPSVKAMLPGYFYGQDAAQKMIATFREDSYHDDVGQLLAAEEMAPGVDLRPALQQLALPALVIAGRQDPMDPGMQYEIHLALRNSQLVLLDRCGHFAWLEQPEGFYRAIREFLSGGQAPASSSPAGTLH